MPIDLTVSGISINSSLVQYINVPPSIDVSEAGNFAEVRDSHITNADAPIDVTELGISTEDSLDAPKALSSIEVTELGIITDCSSLLLSKAYSPNNSTHRKRLEIDRGKYKEYQQVSGLGVFSDLSCFLIIFVISTLLVHLSC